MKSINKSTKTTATSKSNKSSPLSKLSTTKPKPKTTKTTTSISSISNYIFGFCLLGIGYYTGCQHALMSIASSTQTTPTPTATATTQQQQQSLQSQSHQSSSLSSFSSSSSSSTSSKSASSSSSSSKSSSSSSSTDIFQLHEHIELIENRNLFQKQIVPKVTKLLSNNGLEKLKLINCPKENKNNELQPYIDILKNIQNNPLYYEDENSSNNHSNSSNNQNNQNINHCPIIFLFYFEGGTQMTATWLEYYKNIKTKRCLNFIVNKRHENNPNTTLLLKDVHGYNIVGQSHVKQDKTISMSLGDIKKQYGDDILVSVNDLDHLLVWFDDDDDDDNDATIPKTMEDDIGKSSNTKEKPYRYSTYTDIVLLYVYELLSTEGCSNQNVHEKYVVPCTCLMKNNDVYESTVVDAITKKETPDNMIWSEYGVTNRFHPTANFYLDRSNEYKQNNMTTSKFQNEYAYTIGTVYANLRNYDYDIITHHKIGYKTKKIYSRAVHCGVIHARSTNMIQSLSKYHHFLSNQHQNIFRSSDDTSSINDAMGCSISSTQSIIDNEKKCRKVKEFANILVIGHQKRSCLNSPYEYSEEHCISDMTCCLTY